jgi:DNA-binding IclR family transcriptional regulator
MIPTLKANALAKDTSAVRVPGYCLRILAGLLSVSHPATYSDIARVVGCTKSFVHRAMGVLEEAGLVTREHKANGRVGTMSVMPTHRLILFPEARCESKN